MNNLNKRVARLEATNDLSVEDMERWQRYNSRMKELFPNYEPPDTPTGPPPTWEELITKTDCMTNSPDAPKAKAATAECSA